MTYTCSINLRKESLISDGHQFHKYQQNEHSNNHLSSELNTKIDRDI